MIEFVRGAKQGEKNPLPHARDPAHGTLPSRGIQSFTYLSRISMFSFLVFGEPLVPLHFTIAAQVKLRHDLSEFQTASFSALANIYHS